MSLRRFVPQLIAIGLALALPVAAVAQEAIAAKTVNVRAGPGRDYPLVVVVGAGSPLAVQGCLDNYSWCDVVVAGTRGWVYAGNIDYPYQSANVPLIQYGAVIGLPIVGFVIGSYWGDYYRNRPFYRDRARWYHHPIPHGPAYRPGGGPGFRPGPPPRPFPGHDGRPGNGRPDRPSIGRPGGPDRPGVGRPGGGERPSVGRPGNPGGNQGRPEGAGRPGGGGRPDGAGRPGGGGRPDGAGRPGGGGGRPEGGGGRPGGGGGGGRPEGGGGGGRPGGGGGERPR